MNQPFLNDRMVEIRLKDLDRLVSVAQLIEDLEDEEREAVKRAKLIIKGEPSVGLMGEPAT